MAELQKIKREKAAEEREKEDIKKQEEERIRLEIIVLPIYSSFAHFILNIIDSFE